jgi:hypothetical protein
MAPGNGSVQQQRLYDLCQMRCLFLTTGGAYPMTHQSAHHATINVNKEDYAQH